MAALIGKSSGGGVLRRGGGGRGMLIRDSSESSSGYAPPAAATADTSGNESQTMGKPIPIIIGAARPKGEVIWIRPFRTKTNECRADVAVCFGRNPFARTLGLVRVSQDGTDIYSRAGDKVIDPPSDVRFYDGTQTTADPLIVSHEGADAVPAWTGYIYAVLENVKLGEFRAEFSDTTVESSTIIATGENCDDDLEGVTLVYDDETRRYYGIIDPGTPEPYLIVSDGCQISSRTFIGINPYWDDPSDPRRFCAESLTVIPCTGLVLVVGFEIDESDGSWYQDPVFKVINPISGQIVYEPNRSLNGRVYMFPYSNRITSLTPPFDSGVTFDVIYKMPGESSLFVALRKYDPSDISGTVTTQLGLIGASLGSGNISGFVFDIETGDNGDDRTYDLLQYVEHDIFVTAGTAPVAFTSIPQDARFGTQDAPEVDEFILCKTTASGADLAGYSESGGSIRVYRFNHSSDGMETTVDVTVALPTGFETTGFTYDEDSNLVLFSASHPDPMATLLDARLYKIGPSGSVTYVELGDKQYELGSRQMFTPSGGDVVITNPDRSQIFRWNVDTDTATEIYDGVAPTSEPTIDLAAETFRIPTLDGEVTYTFASVATEDVSVQSVITDICALKGYASGDLSFQGISALTMRGMTIGSTVQVADLLNRMGKLYGFLFTETDGKLKFRRRRNSDGSFTADFTLGESDLVEGPAALTTQRQAATTILGAMELTFVDPDLDFEPNSLLVRRTAGMFTENQRTRDETLSLPVALLSEDARSYLFEAFFAQSEAETRVSFSVGPEHGRMEPGDIVTISAFGESRTVLARRVTHRTESGRVDVEADSFMAQATADAGDPGSEDGDGTSRAVGRYIHLDIPFIRSRDYIDINYGALYHGITTTEVASWTWADLYRSRNGTTFSKIADYDRSPMAVGLTSNAIGQPSAFFGLDTENTLTITVVAGDDADFASVSYLDMMNGANLCAYGRDGFWELISFQDVTDNLDGTLTLSTLQRGLFSTHLRFDPDGDANLHQIGDIVVLLDPVKVTVSTDYPASDIGIRERFAVLASGATIAETPRPWATWEGYSMFPMQPADLRAVHTPGESTLAISWEPVSNIPSTWRDDGTESVMPETESYSVYIETTAGDFEFTTSDRSYTWSDYGAELGATSRADEEVTGVWVSRVSPIWGEGYSAFTTGVEA